MCDVIEEIMKKKCEWYMNNNPGSSTNPVYVYLGYDTYYLLKAQINSLAVYSLEDRTGGSDEVCGLQILIVNIPDYIGVGN